MLELFFLQSVCVGGGGGGDYFVSALRHAQVAGSCKIWGSRIFPLFYVRSYYVKTTALPLEVGASPSHVDHGGSVLNCYQYQFELAG